MVRRMVSNERPVSGQRHQRPQLHEMQSAVNKQPNLANKKPKAPTEDELLESLENIDMLLANMKAGVDHRERAIHKLGEKY